MVSLDGATWLKPTAFLWFSGRLKIMTDRKAGDLRGPVAVCETADDVFRVRETFRKDGQRSAWLQVNADSSQWLKIWSYDSAGRVVEEEHQILSDNARFEGDHS